MFAAAGDRVWLATPTDSLKARVLRQRPAVSLYIPGADEAVVVQGLAKVLDPLRPSSLLDAPLDTMRSAAGMAAYAAANLGDLLDLSLDFVPVRRRALVAVSPESVVEAPVAHDVVVGLLTEDDGVVALPASWDPSSNEAVLLGERLGAVLDGPVAVALDRSTGGGPGRKQGVMHRGTARRTTAGVAVEIERSTWWNGTSVGTVHWWRQTE
jgi:hypothetical protein